MANRVRFGNLGSSQFGLKVSKPNKNVLTCADKDLLFDSTRNRTGLIYAGGGPINFSSSSTPSETQGQNFLITSKKDALGYIPLIVAVEKNRGELDVYSGDEQFFVSDISLFETTTVDFCPIEADVSKSQQNTSVQSQSTPDRGRSYSGVATSREDCLNCSFFVLRIPCGYGYMNSTYFA
ncbi:MAG: hypothetical protein GOVbin3695_56 [Prokaryotic dsDNA virus sp.]|nr:MAG: hypothetical protein GOVbin3695_56 [Prokaryotic dsDNA virus sp.]|tara:strand:+ start:1712 stop:2251 length:540 start_codon:yes stop_codon:yes gene_type:complete